MRLVIRPCMAQHITIGIVGCGSIGGALMRWLQTHNPSVRILVSDPPKGMNDSMTGADVVFVSIHVPTESDGTQNLDLLKPIINGLPAATPVFVRTTTLPGTP